MPAQLVEAFSDRLAENSYRQDRRHASRARWICRISIQPGNTPIQVILVVVLFQLFVTDWPVIGDAVESAHSEVGWVKAREMGGPVMCASTDSVEHQHRRWIRACFRYRIVFPPPANVRAEVKSSTTELNFPIRTLRRIIAGPDPAALFQAHNFRAQIGQPRCDHRAGCAGSNYQNVNVVVLQGPRHLYRAWASSGRSPKANHR